MQDKRDKQDGGLGGWVAKRAGEWDLEGQDETTLQRQRRKMRAAIAAIATSKCMSLGVQISTMSMLVRSAANV